MKLHTSSRGITHKVIKGYYKCMRAVGSVKYLQEGRHRKNCQHCFKRK